MTKNSFGKRLLLTRVERGMSQAELAETAGVAAAQISRYESDKNFPRPHIVAKLAHALQVNTQWLTDGSAHPSEPETTMRPDGNGMVEVTFRPDEETGRLFREMAERIGKTPDELLNWVMTEMSKISGAPGAPSDDIYKELSERVARLEAEAAARRKEVGQ